MIRHPAERWSILRMSRREFLRKTAAGVPLTAMAAALAACAKPTRQPSGGGGESAGVHIGTIAKPVQQPFFDDIPPIEPGLEPEPGPLRIYNWSDYFWKKVLDDFGQEYGVDTEYTTFYNMEEAIQKLRTGELQVDVTFPTSETIPKMVAGKLLQPLNLDYIPNLQKYVWPFLADPYYDKGPRYTVPYAVYQTGIGWRTDMVDSEDIEPLENPWDVFWNPKYKDMAGLYDDFRETLGVGLYHSGINDPNETDPDTIAEARDALMSLTSLMNIKYTINGAYVKLPRGQVGVHHAWSGDMVYAPYNAPKEDRELLRYLWPPRASSSNAGGYIANDTYAITANAEHPVLAHHFLNYMMESDHALKNFSWTIYQPPQKGIDPGKLVDQGYVLPNLESAVVQESDFTSGQIPYGLSPAVERVWLDAWEQVKAG